MAENGVSSKKSLRDITVNIDVSEALTGLKAVQREAKQAARAIKELDEMYINEGAALYIKGRLAYGIHPDNLTNNLNALNEGRMNFDWGVFAGIAGIKMDKEPQSTGMLNDKKLNWNNIEDYSSIELVDELKRRGIRPVKVFEGGSVTVNRNDSKGLECPELHKGPMEVIIIKD